MADNNESDERAIQALSNAGAFCGDCGFEPGDRGCPDCERSWASYVKELREAGWAPREEVLQEAADAVWYRLQDAVLRDRKDLQDSLEQMRRGELRPALTKAEEEANARIVSIMHWCSHTDQGAAAAQILELIGEMEDTDHGHVYLSTGCLHGEHAYCKGEEGQAAKKRPATCKFCQALCICGCHKTPNGHEFKDWAPPCTFCGEEVITQETENGLIWIHTSTESEFCAPTTRARPQYF